MKVQLKQPEIIEALKGYLTSQGINVQGKEVTVDFTAGRKESGLSAEINITDKTSELTSKVVVQRNPLATVATTVVPAATPDAAVEGEQPEAPPAGEPVKVTSLFT